jgi:hypothetical protein
MLLLYVLILFYAALFGACESDLGLLVFIELNRLYGNATFNNILVISWRSILLVAETGVPGENHRPVASH